MDLLPVIKKIKGIKVLVIGDLVLDCFLWGKVRRISPEAPVPVVEVKNESFVLGGAANVANNIASLGGMPTVVGVLGADRAGQTMQDIFNAQGIRFLTVQGKRPTTVKTRVIAHSQQVVRIDQEDTRQVSGKTLKGLLDIIGQQVRQHDVVIGSDYLKGVISKEVMRAVLNAARGRKFVAVDPKVGHFHLYKGASIITPNLLEASSGAGIDIKDEKSLLKAGVKLLKKLNCKAVLLTRGEDGMSLFQKNSVTHIPTVARKVYDVTGAGDTVVGVLSMARAAGAGMVEAAVLANHAAGIVVAEVGTATTTPGRLRQSLRSAKIKIESVGL